MKARLAILGLLISLLAGLALFYRPSSSILTRRAFGPAEVARMPIPTDAFSPFHGDTTLSLETLRENVLASYRLRPDARFLRAIGVVRRLAGGADSAVVARFSDGRWVVTCGSQEVGMVAELPEFPEMLDLLTGWARTQAWTNRWGNASGPRRLNLQYALDRLDAKAALHEADRAWKSGDRDAVLFRYATRAYTLWALQTPDQVRIGEDVEARALATLAYARALGAEEPARETCLLAEVLGYRACARALAGELPVEDGVRRYVTWDDAGLGAAAEDVRTLEASFFLLLRAAQRGDYESWQKLLPRFDRGHVPAEAVLATGLRIPRFEAHLPAAEGTLRAVIEAVGAPRSREAELWVLLTSPTLAARVAEFERAVAGRAESPGVLLDPDLVRAQRRTLVYSALDCIGQHYMESLASVEATRWFARGSDRAPGATGFFQRWYVHMANAATGKGDLAALRSDLDSVECSREQVLRTFDVVRTLIPLGDPSLRGAAQAVARRLDTRPRYRVALGDMAAGQLLALNLAERCYVSAAGAEGASDLHLLAMCARYRGDLDSLRVLMVQSAPDPWWRRAVLDVAANADELPDTLVRRTFENEIATGPATWPVADEYSDWLEKRKRYSEARTVLERWLSQARSDSGSVFEPLFARTQIARLLQLEGRPEDALQVLSQLHDSQQLGALERKALVLQDAGHPVQALAVGWAAYRRYPQILGGRTALVELLWRQGRFGQAAAILHAPPLPVSAHDWFDEVAPRFVACFRGHEREGIKAAEALMKAGFREQATIGTLGQKLSEEGLDALAFEIQSRIRATGIAQVEISARAYGYLKRARGEQPALAWLRSHLPRPSWEPLCMFAHQEGLPELLWTMSPASLEGPNGDYYWLTRAAACMEAGPAHPHYVETAQHLASAQGSYYLEIARYLMDLRGEAQILQLARTMKRRAEIYYFVGLKAEHAGRLRDAADWYLMSVEAGAINNSEPRWAFYQLQRWAIRQRSLDVIARSRPV